jgi:hypothetical protein
LIATPLSNPFVNQSIQNGILRISDWCRRIIGRSLCHKEGVFGWNFRHIDLTWMKVPYWYDHPVDFSCRLDLAQWNISMLIQGMSDFHRVVTQKSTRTILASHGCYIGRQIFPIIPAMFLSTSKLSCGPRNGGHPAIMSRFRHCTVCSMETGFEIRITEWS